MMQSDAFPSRASPRADFKLTDVQLCAREGSWDGSFSIREKSIHEVYDFLPQRAAAAFRAISWRCSWQEQRCWITRSLPGLHAKAERLAAKLGRLCRTLGVFPQSSLEQLIAKDVSIARLWIF